MLPHAELHASTRPGAGPDPPTPVDGPDGPDAVPLEVPVPVLGPGPEGPGPEGPDCVEPLAPEPSSMTTLPLHAVAPSTTRNAPHRMHPSYARGQALELILHGAAFPRHRHLLEAA